jgi:hypothetical protein
MPGTSRERTGGTPGPAAAGPSGEPVRGTASAHPHPAVPLTEAAATAAVARRRR